MKTSGKNSPRYNNCNFVVIAASIRIAFLFYFIFSFFVFIFGLPAPVLLRLKTAAVISLAYYVQDA